MILLRHTVFIVDDDADDRESIRDAFLENRHDHDYTFMHNGEHLMEKLAGKKNSLLYPSVILLDLNMPGKDGKDVLKELKGNSILQPIPVIIFTTSSSERDKEATYK